MVTQAGLSLWILLLLLLDAGVASTNRGVKMQAAVHLVRQRVRRERLAVITVATEQSGPQVTQLLDSCSTRYNITVLGKGTEFRGMLTKLTLVMKHLRVLSPEQLVLFLDQDVR